MVLNFVKGFFCIYWDIHMVFIFQFVNVVYHIDFCILKNPCIPGRNPTWSWCMRFLMCYWILFAKGLLRIFCICQWYWPIVFFFVCVVFVWFWYQGNGGLIEWAWECSFLCNFQNSFRRIGVNSSLNVW